MSAIDKSRRTTLRTWGPVGLLGTAAATAVAALFAAAVSGPAYSPSDAHMPVPADGPAETVQWHTVTTTYCFAGRDDWREDLYIQPPCRQ
jgi:hypothetical protein